MKGRSVLTRKPTEHRVNELEKELLFFSILINTHPLTAEQL